MSVPYHWTADFVSPSKEALRTANTWFHRDGTQFVSTYRRGKDSGQPEENALTTTPRFPA